MLKEILKRAVGAAWPLMHDNDHGYVRRGTCFMGNQRASIPFPPEQRRII